jgi:general secretion pathway protein D
MRHRASFRNLFRLPRPCRRALHAAAVLGDPLKPITHPVGRIGAVFAAVRALRAGLALAFLAAAALAVTSARAAEDTVTLNFVNADVDAVVRAISEITGRNFVVDPRVKGTINITSARPVPRDIVYPTFLSALRLQGFAVIESGGVTKIVPEADAKQHGGTVTRGPVSAGGDRIVTQVTTLKYESAAQIVNILRPLITPNNTIAAYPSGNALVITDYADNVRRIDRIVASLDQPPSGEPVLVPLRYASAIDLVTMLNKLVGDQGATQPGGVPSDSQQRVAIIADPRSNSILLRAENPARLARVRALIADLDTQGRPGGNMFIIYLRNAEAARVALTLRSLLAGGSDVSQGLPSSTLSGNSGTATGSTAAAPPAGVGSAAPGGAGALGPNAFAAGGAMIQADTANNALIIMAPEPIYNNLRAIVEKLDIRRAQVLVEALIVEVSADKAAEFGIQWQALSGIGKSGVQGFGGTNFNPQNTAPTSNIITGSLNLANLAQGLNAGILNGTLTIPGLGQIVNLAFLARALETQANANILSTPTLLMLDNEEAKIVVGQNVPFITGQYTTAAANPTVSPFQTIERRDVGITLRVRPQITEGGSVRLIVYQEVSRVESTNNPAGIITDKRSIESSVAVEDGQIVVLGGLIQDQLIDNNSSVPLVGELPLIGALFRYNNRTRTKTNLMIFIKPSVVRGPAGASDVTQDRYDYLIGEQNKLNPPPRIFWNDLSYPQLAPSGTLPGSAPLVQPIAPAPVLVPPPMPLPDPSGGTASPTAPPPKAP